MAVGRESGEVGQGLQQCMQDAAAFEPVAVIAEGKPQWVRSSVREGLRARWCRFLGGVAVRPGGKVGHADAQGQDGLTFRRRDGCGLSRRKPRPSGMSNSVMPGARRSPPATHASTSRRDPVCRTIRSCTAGLRRGSCRHIGSRYSRHFQAMFSAAASVIATSLS